MDEQELKNNILEHVKNFYESRKNSDKFFPGKTELYYGQAVYDHNEVGALIDSLLDGWLGIGRKGAEFEQNFSNFVGLQASVLTNSGSSANLLAVTSLMSHQFEKRLNPGDEIITQAMTFPTTFNPIVQNGLKPVLVDSNLGSYTVKVDAVEKAITGKTRAMIFHHPLGNPNDMETILEIAQKHDLFVIEDCCDALGSEFGGRKVGSFGNLSTFSF